MIKINLPKAKDIAHNMRRANRDEVMNPLDVQATIPLFAADAEAKRQVLRDLNSDVQQQIDSADSPDAIKEALAKL